MEEGEGGEKCLYTVMMLYTSMVCIYLLYVPSQERSHTSSMKEREKERESGLRTEYLPRHQLHGRGREEISK